MPIYIKKHCRSLVARSGEKERAEFIVATSEVRGVNEVKVILYDDEEEQCQIVASFEHDGGEVHSMCAHPTDISLVYTCSLEQTHLWRMSSSSSEENPNDDNDSNRLKSVARLPDETIQVDIDTSTTDRVAALQRSGVVLWSAEKLQASSRFGERELCRYVAARWDPHYGERLVTLDASCAMRGWDARSGDEAFSVEHAHEHGVRDVDFNVNKAHHLVTCGDDAYIKFWDVRRLGAPVKQIRDAHSHWVCQARYHTHYDQLLISAGTDCIAKLWDIQSVSSSVAADSSSVLSSSSSLPASASPSSSSPSSLPAASTALSKKDGLLAEFREHGDSIYALAWTASESNAWVFASLSYDGHLAVHQVPQDDQYKIIDSLI
jgi:EARP and GARP complex-interacting protein 1